MSGIRALRKIQLGKEGAGTPGTLVPATLLWAGKGTIEDQRELVFPEQDVGILGGVARTYVPKVFAALSMEAVEATFEQLPIILSAAVQNVVTGDADGVGTGRIYRYALATTAAQPPQTWTIEGGDNQQAERFGYGYVESFELAGAAGEALKIAAEWRGREVLPASFTAGVSYPTTLEEILFGQGQLAIDDSGGTPGTTVLSNTLLGMSLKHTTGYVPRFSASGALHFATLKQGAPEVLLDITFEHDAAAVAEIAAWRAQKVRLLQLAWQGAELETAGEYTHKTLEINLVGKWERFAKLDEIDGNDVVTGTFRARYHAADAMLGEYIVVNEEAAL